MISTQSFETNKIYCLFCILMHFSPLKTGQGEAWDFFTSPHAQQRAHLHILLKLLIKKSKKVIFDWLVYQFDKMKLFTHNMLTSKMIKNVQVGYPLKLKVRKNFVNHVIKSRWFDYFDLIWNSYCEWIVILIINPVIILNRRPKLKTWRKNFSPHWFQKCFLE